MVSGYDMQCYKVRDRVDDMLCYARVAYAPTQAHLARARRTERAHGGRPAARPADQIPTRSCDGSVRRTRRRGLADDRAARRARRAAARHRGTAPARLREQQHAQRGARQPCDAAYRTCTTCCGAASNRRWQQSLHVIGCPGAAPGRSLASIEPSPRPLAPPNGPRCIVCRVCRKVLAVRTPYRGKDFECADLARIDQRCSSRPDVAHWT